MTNFHRQYRLSAGTKNGNDGFEIGKEDPDTGLALHINFTIEKSDSSTANTSKIKIWNLTREHLNVLAKTGCEVDLSAGYGNSLPCIFRGVVSNAIENMDGADRSVELDVVDGFADLSETFISLSYSGQTTTRRVADDIASRLSLPVSLSVSAEKLLDTVTFPNGYSYIGFAKYALNQIANKTGLTWNIQNGILEIRKSNESISTIVHKMNKDTGLLGIPKRIYSSQVSSTSNSSDSSSDSLYGYEIEYFLNGAIRIGDKIYLETEEVTGLFMVYSLIITGDNLESDFTCTAQVTEVKK